MGSPFQACKLTLEGPWVPDLDVYGWVPIFARSADEKRLALARWDTSESAPGFHVVLIDEIRQSVWESTKFPGCCFALYWTDISVMWKSFPDLEGSFPIRDELLPR